MDIRQKQNRHLENIEADDLSDSIIYNLTKMKVLTIQLENQYAKQNYGRSSIPFINFKLHSNYPIFYFIGGTIYHSLTFKHRKITLFHLFFHAAVIISLNQSSKLKNIKELNPEKWENYLFHNKNYESGLKVKVSNFSMMEYVKAFLHKRIRVEKISSMLSLRPF